jgi:WD40 repeat protein
MGCGEGKQEGTSMVHEGWVYALAVTRDGKRILSGGEDKRIRVWDVETHELIEEWASHTGDICCIALSPDDRLAASGDVDGKIVIREMKRAERSNIQSTLAIGVTHSASLQTGRSSLALFQLTIDLRHPSV